MLRKSNREAISPSQSPFTFCHLGGGANKLSPRFSIIHHSEACTMMPLNTRQSAALAAHRPVLHYEGDCHPAVQEKSRGSCLRHRQIEMQVKTELEKREGTNGHIFSDLRNGTLACIRMTAGVWHSCSNWISQAPCPLMITC